MKTGKTTPTGSSKSNSSDQAMAKFGNSPSIMPKKLKHLPDQYLRDGVSPIDMVLVYEEKADERLKQNMRNHFEKNLRDKRLVLEKEKCENLSGKTYNFVKIHAPYHVLAAHAENAGLKVPLKGIERPTAEGGEMLSESCVFRFCSLPKEFFEATELKRTFAGKFNRKQIRTFEPHHKNSFFAPMQRIQIVWQVLEHTSYEPNQAVVSTLGIEKLLATDVYLAAYPLHDGGYSDEKKEIGDLPWKEWNKRRLLHKFWTSKNMCCKNQPLDLIHQYFGMHIAIYFAWLHCYTRALIPLSVVGIVCFIYGIVFISQDIPVEEICDKSSDIGNTTMCPTCPIPACVNWALSQNCINYSLSHVFSNNASMFYVLFLMAWTMWFQIYWNRAEAELKYEWHDTNPELNIEHIRLQYETVAKGVTSINPVTGVDEPYVSKLNLLHRRIVSNVLIIFLILLLMTVLFFMIVLRVRLIIFMNHYTNYTVYDQKVDRILVALISAILSLVVIFVFDKLYRKVAWASTSYECHRHSSCFEASFTYKLVMFQFFNYYGPMIYISFLKGVFVRTPVIKDEGVLTPENCDPGGCMSELSIQLIVTLIFKQLVQGIGEMALPKMCKFVKEKECQWKDGRRQQWQEDYTLNEAPPLPLVDEYLEMVIQYGFVAIFSVAFPLAPVFALLNNLLEIRGDAEKWTSLYRRPVPLMVPNIGPWFRMIMFFSYVGVIANAGLMGFTSDIIPRLVYTLSLNSSATFHGFLESALSYSTKDNCSYFDYKDENLNKTFLWWKVFAARAVFILVFVVVAGVISRVVQMMMSPVPEKVDTLLRRERYIVWQKFYEDEKATKALEKFKVQEKSPAD